MYRNRRWERTALCLALVLALASCSSKPTPPAAEPTLHAVLFHEILPDNLEGPCASPDYFRDVLRMIQIGDRDTITSGEVLLYLQGGAKGTPSPSCSTTAGAATTRMPIPCSKNLA